MGQETRVKRQGTGKGSGFRVQGRCGQSPAAGGQWSVVGGRELRSMSADIPHSVPGTQYPVHGFRYLSACRCLLAACLLAACLLAATPAQAAETTDFTDQLAALAAKCEELGLKDQAQVTRQWSIPRFPGRQYLFLPAANDPLQPKTGAPMIERQWYDKFMAIRRQRAAERFKTASIAIESGNAPLAYQLLHEALREDPDHAEARRILGFVKDGRGVWKSPGEAPLEAPVARLDHPKLGWKARGYWRLETPHFQIVTDHSAREALEAGGQLEKLHSLWRQIFFSYWTNADALAARFHGANDPLAPDRPRMQVVLFKSCPEYVQKLAPIEPQIALTVGYYSLKQQITFLFAGDTSVYPTWYHEATHQLFQEAVPRTTAQPGESKNFWALEGAALYMESLSAHDGYWTAGGWEAERLQFARNRALAGDFYMPLARLSEQGREQLQQSADIRKLYSQAAGLAHFLIDGQGAQYREPLIGLLSAVYRGDDSAGLLAKTTGQPLEKLDDQYRQFLNVTDETLASTIDHPRIRSLFLARTSVTDAGLARLAACTNLVRLDLSLTAATDQGLKSFSGAGGLTQLLLAGTKITDASLPLVATFKNLEDLDLAGLAISDEGLASLSELRKLKELRLDGTPITDAGLMHLRGLKQLESLSREGTKVTPEGLKKLKASLPKLKTV